MQDAINNPSTVHGTSQREAQDVRPYGLLAEFHDAHAVIHAAQKVRDEGYTKIDAYSPFPVEGLSEALGHRDFHVPRIMLAGGILGGLGGFSLLHWCTTIAYKMNIGGRPLVPWPTWLPITFECTVLIAAFSGVFGMLILNGLPQPYHPLFDAPNFNRASSDLFFLCVEAEDPKYDLAETQSFLEGLGPDRVTEVMLKK